MGLLDTAKPIHRIEIIEPDGSEPKYVISPNIFLDSERPANSNQVSEIYLTSLNVILNLDGSVNVCELELKHEPKHAPAIDMDSTVKVYLGYYNQDFSEGAEYSLVFTGYVTRKKVHLRQSYLECKSKLNRIITLRKKISFSKLMTIDEIIKKLAIEEGSLEEAINGITQSNISKSPGYAISEQKPILDHIKLLAEHSGLNVYMDVFDKFHTSGWVTGDLKDAAGQDNEDWINDRGKTESENSNLYKHTFTFGRDLIACDFERTAPKASAVEIISLMPFSDDPVHTIDPPKVEFTSASDTDPEIPKRVFKISHVTREDAEKIAENLFWRINRQIKGKLKVLGAPQVRIGDGIRIAGDIYGVEPFENFKFSSSGSGGEESLDAKIFQISKINHKFNDMDGFITRVDLVEGRAAVGTGAAPEAGAAGAAVEAGVITSTEAEFTGMAERVEIEEPLIKITNAQWDKTEARQGDTLTLTADVEGAQDGMGGEIEIYEHDVDGIHDLITKFPIAVANKKVETTWDYEYHEDTDEIPTDEELEKYGLKYNPPEYFFVVRIKNAEDQSGILKFKDYVEIILKNPRGEPIADEEYILMLPDGSEITGNLDSEGYAKVEGIPPGKVTVRFPKL